jgi:exonuclease III
MNFTQFKLANSFCRVTSGHGGACIYVKNGTETREVNYFQNISEGKNFEITVIELSECKIILVCIYRASDGNFREFLSKLELVILKLSMKGRQLILCGDWNLNFLQENVLISPKLKFAFKFNNRPARSCSQNPYTSQKVGRHLLY